MKEYKLIKYESPFMAYTSTYNSEEHPDWVDDRFGDDIPDWVDDRWGK